MVIDILRLMAFTTGMDQAVSESNLDDIESLLYPIILNEEVDTLSVVGLDGVEIVSFLEDPSSGDYSRERGSNLSEFEFKMQLEKVLPNL